MKSAKDRGQPYAHSPRMSMDAAETATVAMTTIDTHVRRRASRLTRRATGGGTATRTVSCPVMRW